MAAGEDAGVGVAAGIAVAVATGVTVTVRVGVAEGGGGVEVTSVAGLPVATGESGGWSSPPPQDNAARRAPAANIGKSRFNTGPA